MGVLPAAHHSRLYDCMDFIHCYCYNNATVLLLPLLSSTCPGERTHHSTYHSSLRQMGYSALHWAAHNGHVDAIIMLLEHGAELEAETKVCASNSYIYKDGSK